MNAKGTSVYTPATVAAKAADMQRIGAQSVMADICERHDREETTDLYAVEKAVRWAGNRMNARGDYEGGRRMQLALRRVQRLIRADEQTENPIHDAIAAVLRESGKCETA